MEEKPRDLDGVGEASSHEDDKPLLEKSWYVKSRIPPSDPFAGGEKVVAVEDFVEKLRELREKFSSVDFSQSKEDVTLTLNALIDEVFGEVD